MGAGDYLAGEFDLAGEDPSADPSPRRDVTPPTALLFDGATRTFLFEDDDSGRLQSIHPVDQKVALGLMIELGKISSAPDVGNSIRSIRYIDSPKLQAQVDDAVRLAVGSMVTAGDIRQIAISIRRPNRHAFSVVYEYENLRARGRGRDQQRSVTVTPRAG